VQGLDPVIGDADGFVGEIVMPVTSVSPGVLREDLVLPELGCPLDLDANGVLNGADHSIDYELCRSWSASAGAVPSGTSQVQLQTILGVAL
jgi:hypothetical protein